MVLSLTQGIRSEEARALRWDHVDLEASTISVWRSVALPKIAVTASPLIRLRRWSALENDD